MPNRPSRFVPLSTMSHDIIERRTNRLGIFEGYYFYDSNSDELRTNYKICAWKSCEK